MENNAIRHPEEFDCTRDRTITQRWDNYVTKLKRYFIMTGMNDPAAKQACLLYYGGDALSNIFETLENQLALVNEDDEVIDIFTATIDVFNQHFTSGESLTYERSNFRATSQLADESVTDFITRLRKKAAFCRFDEYSLEDAMIDQFI